MAGNQKAALKYSKDFTRHFKELLPDLIRDLTYEGPFKSVPKVNEHVSKCLQYNLVHGKMTRGLAVPVSFRLLSDNPSEEMMKSAHILGWCIEMLQACFLVADDIMDGSVTRRGQTCWYQKDNIGLMAINDSLILESCIYAILRKYFKDKDFYRVTVDAFLKVRFLPFPPACQLYFATVSIGFNYPWHIYHGLLNFQTTRYTTIGQALDMLSQVRPQGSSGPQGKIDDFNMKLYNNIVKHKTSYYSFYFPVQVGMGLVSSNRQRSQP